MQDELKMQAELKKIIANSTADNTIEELSDEELEAVAGGKLVVQCVNLSAYFKPKIVCVFRSLKYSA